MILCKIATVLGALYLKFATVQIRKLPCQKFQNVHVGGKGWCRKSRGEAPVD